jgi:4-amino-4-deoxy-L-arabinose transferase-like glycosyltransferase
VREKLERWTSRHPRLSTHARVWRSPPDQPRWTRPALLAIAAIAAVAYAWGMNGAALEPFYGAAARSMSMSWHDFLFGAFDPAGTVSVDKLPGALWPQALSLRIFGFHIWAIVLPQVLEGVITVLVLFRVMRRLAGPAAGITAAGILALSPVTVALNRGNVSDSLLILLTVLAADATVWALISGHLRSLLLAGVWVGLAFQAKMLQAWLILPALAIAYLLAAPASLRVRVRNLALAGLATVVVSLSWMTVVSLVPSDQRPYVDGTQNDSVFSQVFDYNGIARLGHGKGLAGAGHTAEFLTQLSASGGSADNLAEHVAPSWHRLLDGLYGRDIGWLVPAALIAAAAVVLARRGHGRRDLQRTSVLLWGVWLLVLWVFFSDGVYLHSYYLAALAPALAGLCGTGVALAWSQRERPAVRLTLAGALVATLAYGIYLLNGATGVPGWLIPAAAVVAAAALGLLAVGHVPRVLTSVSISRPPSRDITVRAMLVAIAAALLLPAVASALMVTRGLGPFAAPFEPASATESRAEAKRTSSLSARIVELIAEEHEAPIVFATDTSQLAAPYILASGKEILPIGGFEGGIPAPTVKQLAGYVSSGQLRVVLVPRSSRDPRLAWVYSHCTRTKLKTSGKVPLVLYECGGT